MIAYGILDRDAKLTDFGKELYDLKDNPDELYLEFSKHILLNLNGINLVQCVLDMHVSGETINLIKLREWLEERGIHFPRGGKHPSIMRLWLEKAGIFLSGWNIDEDKFLEIIGMSISEIESIAVLSPEQKAFVKTLSNIDGNGPFISNEIEKLASATYGIKFNEKNLPKQVLYPLEKIGYISLSRGTKQAGRGAKPFVINLTPKFKKEILKPLTEQFEKQIQSDLRPLLRKNIKDIIKDIDSKDIHIKGLALEALGFKILRLLDIEYLATRLRGTDTGGAEVDLIFQTSRLIFSRWQVQCKNTKSVSLDAVAKEVGLTHFLKSNAIIIISTGKIGPEARKYSNKIMTDSNLCIVLIDGDDISKIIENPTNIVDIFNREARQAMKLKKLEL